jgi:hypothetical protein
MTPEKDLKHFENELKELAKRDTNDFLREVQNPAKEFRSLMDGATPFYRELIQRLPDKSTTDFNDKLHEIFKIACNLNKYVQQEIIDLVATKEKIKSNILRKEFNIFIMGSDSPVSSESLRLGQRLLSFFATQTGISSTPQRPLYHICEVSYESLIEYGYEFIKDNSTEVLFIKCPDGKILEMDTGNKDFSELSFKIFEISTPNKEPVKDIVSGLCALVSSLKQTRKFKRIKFFDFIETVVGAIAAFPTGNENQDVIIIKPSVDGKTPDVQIIANGFNDEDIFILPPPLQKEPIDYLATSETQKGMDYLKSFLYTSQALSDSDKLRSFTHKLQMIFPAPTRRKMRKANRGLQGSGKSTDAELFTAFVYGDETSGAYNDEKELWSTAHYNPVQSIDNWEGMKKQKQEEFALLHATGGNKQFRKLYTDRIMLRYEPRSQIIETAIEGFTSPESKEREQEFIFDKKYQDPNFFLSKAESLVKKHRNLMWSSFLNALSIKVLPDYQRRFDHYEKYLARRPHPKQRFNDFIARQALMIDLVRDYWGITTPTEQILDEWVDQWILEATNSDTETDPAVQRLELIFSNPKYTSTSLREDNQEFSGYRQRLTSGVTSNQLHAMFCVVEKDHGLPRAFNSPAVLGQRIKGSVRIWNNSYGVCTISDRGKLAIYSFTFKAAK